MILLTLIHQKGITFESSLKCRVMKLADMPSCLEGGDKG